MTTELVFLDLDGCLVDSTEAITTTIHRTLLEVGAEPPETTQLAWCVGPPLLESLRRLLTDAGADPALAPECLDIYRGHYLATALASTGIVPGIPAALDRLAERARLAVVTSKPLPAAVALLEHLGLAERFLAVYAPDADHRVERKATTLGRALGELRPDGGPSATVMVGDRSHDVEAGLACGTATVGVLWGAGDRDELRRAGAHHIVARPDELVGTAVDH